MPVVTTVAGSSLWRARRARLLWSLLPLARCGVGTVSQPRRAARSTAGPAGGGAAAVQCMPPLAVRLEVGVTVTGSRRYDSAAESYFYWPPGRRGRGSVVLTRSTPRRAGPKGPPGHESDGTSRLTRMPVPCLCSLAARRRRHAGGRHTEVVLGAGGANDYFCRPGHTILGGQKLWHWPFTPAAESPAGKIFH